jgi:hypothetical protein
MTILGYVWLWFVLKRPDKWGAWLDKENDFYVRMKILSVPNAERSKKWEKGLPGKLLAGFIPVIGTGGMIFIGLLVLRHWLLTK